MGCTHNLASVGSSAKAAWQDWAVITCPATMSAGDVVSGSAIKTFGGNFVKSLTKSATTGEYIVQLNGPFPAAAPFIAPYLATPAVGTTARDIRYKVGSYNATTGQFILFVTTVSVTTPAASDPIVGCEIHLEIVSQRLKTIGK